MVMATPSPQQVGREFVRQYYTVLHEAPDVLHRFYSSGSTFVHGGVDRPDRPTEEPVVGQLEIDKKIKILNFKDCHTKIRQVDSQLTIGSGVVVQVTGELSNNGEPMRRFMQTFVLAPQTPKKFYVHNDIFRYQDEVYQDNSDTESEDQQLTENSLVSKTVNSLNINNYYQQGEGLQQQDDAVTGQQSTSSMSSTLPILTSPSPAAEIHKQIEEQQQQQLIEDQNSLLNGHGNVPSVVADVDEVAIQQEIKTTTVEVVASAAVEELAIPVESESIAREELQTTETKINSWAKLVQSSQGDANTVTGSNSQVYQTSQFLSNNPQKPVAKEQNFSNTSANTNSNTNKPVSQQQKSQANSTRDGKQRDNANKSRNSNNQESRGQQQHQQSQQQQPRDSQSQQTPREPRVAAEDEKNFGRYPDGQQVFVGNLNQDLSEAELRTYFSQYGKVMDMRINTNSKQQSGRKLPNYGFVVFEEKQAVENLLAASKSNSITYKNEKGEYRLNVEEKRARQGRISSGFGGKGGNNNRNNRSTSNGSRNGNNNNNNNTGENQRTDRPKKTNNTNNNYSSNNTQEGGYERREGGFVNNERRKTEIHDGQPIVDGGSRRNNANPRRS